MVTAFKEKLNLQVRLNFTVVLRLYLKQYFFSEQIADNRVGALLGIGDNFITKLNVFS